jgi:hypothetical protein
MGFLILELQNSQIFPPKYLRLRAIIVNNLLHLPSAPNLCYKKNIGTGTVQILDFRFRILDLKTVAANEP